jgi:Na+-translocating ferredoxin:NAD+ oxidoreductase RnfE subunit
MIKEKPINGLYLSQINPIISKVKGNEIKTPNKNAAIILAPLSPGIFYNLKFILHIKFHLLEKKLNKCQ